MSGIASSNRVEIRQVKEVTPGTTPTTPALKEVRWTSESLNYNLQNVVSNEVRSDRMTADLIKVQSSAAGDLGFEFSYADHEDFLIGALAANAFSTAIAISATDIAAVNSSSTFTSTTTDFTGENISVGQWVKVSGFTETANNGYHRVTAVAASVLTVADSTLTDEAAGDTVVMTGTMIRNGTDIDFFTIQKFLADADTPTYFNMTGASVNQTTLNVQVGQPISGSFSFLGYGIATATSQISGATTPAATGNEIMNAVDNITSVLIDGAVASSCFNSLNLTINNNLRQQYCVGNLAAVGVATGQFDVTGTIGMFFKDSTMYDKYVNSTAFRISWVNTDNDGNTYIFTLPAVKFESGELSATGTNQDMVFNGNIRAIRDVTTDSMLQMDKFPA